MIRRPIGTIVAGSILALLLCAANSTLIAAEFELLVEPESLLERIANPELVIIDAREPRIYQLGHIKGAINLPVGDTYNPNPPKHRLAPESHIIPLFSNAGIDSNSAVVIYDDGDFKDAARIVWALWVYGHDKASVLAINYQGWKNLGYPVSRVASVLEPKQFISQLQPRQLATQLHTQLAIADPELNLVDVRTEEEYRGEKSKSRRYGHIPGAFSYDWHRMAYRDNNSIRLKSRTELQKLFSALPKDQRVITYCNKGKEAALGNFVLKYLDYDVSLYDGGWHEWGNSTDLPVEGPDSKPTKPANIRND